MSTLSKDACFICDNQNASSEYKIIDGYQLWKCKSCKTIYLDPALENIDQQFIEDTNSKIEYWSTPRFFNSHMRVFKYYFKRRLKSITIFSKSIKNALDVGCGHGYWPQFLEDNGIETKGIDISLEAVSSCIDRGLDVEHAEFMQYCPGKKFDLLSACDVLEHVTDPNSFILKCKSLLNDEGLLYLQVPDVFDFRFPRNHNPLLPHHRWHFKIKSIRVLLEKNGFEVLDYTTGILGVVGEREKRGKIPLWLKIYWAMIQTLKIGNRLHIIARKL